MLETRPARHAPHNPAHAVRPTGEERTFSPDELIVSKTDPKGVITYANDVFERVSAYPLQELVGRPHNLIRHPEMPRAVFKLLWDTLAGGRDLWAYINNLARDALIGYHSNRRSPNREAVARVAPLYARLLAEERRHPNARSAVEASSLLLTGLLAESGQPYDEFVWSIIRDLET